MHFLRTSWLLFATHLKRVAWSRRSLVCVVLAFLPALVALLAARLGRRVEPAQVATTVGFLLQLQVCVPLLALVLGSAAIAEEVEDRTITFLFTRPIPRGAVLLGRWAAILVFVLLVLAASTWALLAASSTTRAGGAPVDAAIRIPLFAAVLAGGAVYTALFAALGVFVRHPVLVGLAYAFAIEGFLANMPIGSQRLTIQYHLRSLIARLGSKQWDLLEGFKASEFDTLPVACTTLVAVLVLALGLGALRIRRKQFELSA
jgi:ABC-2 type transport system permease protein